MSTPEVRQEVTHRYWKTEGKLILQIFTMNHSPCERIKYWWVLLEYVERSENREGCLGMKKRKKMRGLKGESKKKAWLKLQFCRDFRLGLSAVQRTPLPAFPCTLPANQSQNSINAFWGSNGVAVLKTFFPPSFSILFQFLEQKN